jgi:hypothetical protein
MMWWEIVVFVLETVGRRISAACWSCPKSMPSTEDHLVCSGGATVLRAEPHLGGLEQHAELV